MIKDLKALIILIVDRSSFSSYETGKILTINKRHKFISDTKFAKISRQEMIVEHFIPNPIVFGCSFDPH